MRDLNYFPLDVESNIYGMTTLEFEDKTTKVLVATLDCRIYCINYSKFKPQTREVEFTYIPNGAKIISIGALKRGTDDFVIGITHSLAPSAPKGSTRSSVGYVSRDSGTGDYGRLTTYYLNIYASGSMPTIFDLDYVAQGCQTIRLRFVPYHLYQTELISIDTKSGSKVVKRKPFWLLSGGDNSIHAFCEDKPFQSFNEMPIEECFPELSNISGLALWMDVAHSERNAGEFERAVALGLENGSVKLYHCALSKQTNKFELVRESSFDDYTTIIPSVRLFKINSTVPSVLSDILKAKNALRSENNHRFEQLNLLVISSTNPSIIFENVLEAGLDVRHDLPESQRLDCAVASAIGDTNNDGKNELLIGTHGQELLTYQYDMSTNDYYLAHISELNYPIFALSILDLTGDALKDVTILLASGILVMQAAVKDVIEICKRRVDAILTLIS